MNLRWSTAGAVAAGLLILGGGAISASAVGSGGAHPTTQASAIERLGGHLSRVTELLGIDEGNEAAPGTLDDGKDLLPQATLTVEQAVAIAQATGDGALGEVDLEHYHGVLVFNVDIGRNDVKVDAATGDVLNSILGD